MDYLIGFLLIILFGKFVYNSIHSLAMKDKRRYYHPPLITATDIPLQESYEFKPGLLEIMNRFIWSFMGIILLVSIGYEHGATTIFVMLLFFGPPFLIRIVTRLAHVLDRVTVGKHEIEFNAWKTKEKINMMDVKEIILRYSLIKTAWGKSIYPEFIFISDSKEHLVRLNEDFFLSKAERMLVTMQKLFSDKKFDIAWEDNNGAKERLSAV